MELLALAMLSGESDRDDADCVAVLINMQDTGIIRIIFMPEQGLNPFQTEN